MKTTILYDFETNKILATDLTVVEIKYNKNPTSFNTTEYKITNSKECWDLLVPCSVGVFTVDDTWSVVCGGMLLTPAEKQDENKTLVFQTFTPLKLLENAPWVGADRNINNGDFKTHIKAFIHQIQRHDLSVANSVEKEINKTTFNPHCSFTEPKTLQQGVTVNVLEEFNNIFHASNMAYEDGWETKNDKIIPAIKFLNRKALNFRSDMLIDEKINVLEYENEYRGEYGNAVLVIGASKDTDTSHTDTTQTLPPFHAMHRPPTSKKIKWLVVSDERLKSDKACKARAVKEYNQAVTRLELNSVTVKDSVFLRVFDLRLLDVVKADMSSGGVLVRVDGVEYDYANNTAKIYTNREVQD